MSNPPKELHEKLVLEFPNDKKAPGARDELTRVCERIEQERTYISQAHSDLTSITHDVTRKREIGDGLDKALAVERELDENIKKIKKGPFTIFAVDAGGNLSKYPDPSAKIVDIGIYADDSNVSEEKADFKVEIDRTIMVINQVVGPEGPASKWALDRKNEDRRSQYLRELKGICHVGLEHQDPSQLKLANKSLQSFREQFVANEAATVKNNYLWRLGWYCLAMSVVACLGYIFVRLYGEPPTLYYFRNFFILVAGASVGTWLSFSLRRVTINFLDLVTLEEDRLDPFIRVLFVTALTCIIGLLIWTEAASFGIGKFATEQFRDNGVSALLMGLLLGIAERTMATAVQKRATEFGSGIGGK